jgi:hypothetical protein
LYRRLVGDTKDNLVSRRYLENASSLEQWTKIQTILWMFVAFSILFYGYTGRIWSEIQVFRVVDGWCDLKTQGLGNHCFGDFGLAYNRGYGISTYEGGNLASSNTPLTAMIFEILRLFSYRTALVIYLVVLAACLLLPFVNSASQVRRSSQLQMGIYFGLISSGGLAALDRGNHVVTLIPFIVAFFWAVKKEHWKRASVMLAIMTMLKFWGFIFVVALIARGRWKNAFSALGGATVMSLGLLTYFPGEMTQKVRSIFEMVGNREYANQIAPYALSIQGLFRRSHCALTSSTWCDTQQQADSWIASPLLGATILAILLSIVALMARSRLVPDHIWNSALISVCFIGVPDSPIYQISLVAAIAALVSIFGFNFNLRDWKWSSLTLMTAISLSSIPLSINQPGNSRFALGISGGDVFFRLDLWLIPIIWLIFTLVACIEFVCCFSKKRDN